MNRKLLWLAALLPARVFAQQPNILLIIADDMGYGDLNCYGNLNIKTPNIDKLAATGTRFTQSYSGSAVSSPSRCALMTGKHTGNTTIRDNFARQGGIEGKKGASTIRRQHILESDTTIATVLSAAGYRTCLVNKWHLDGFNPEATPLNRGFDEFYGWLISTAHSNDPYYYPYWRFRNDKLVNIKKNKGGAHKAHNTDISTQEAIDFMRRNKRNPFFLYLAYDAPHEPYNIDNTSWYDEMAWDDHAKRYASLITHMDEAIGRLLAELDRLGLRENTLIVFTSDNGAAQQAPLKELNCNGTLNGRKGLMYEGGIRIPFIVNQPNKVPTREVNTPIYFPDILPTLASIAGGRPPQGIDGIDLAPLFFGGEIEAGDRPMYWEFPGKQRALRKGDWKIVTVKGWDTPLELYNLQDDVGETKNLASRYPEKMDELKREMEQIRKPSANWPLEDE